MAFRRRSRPVWLTACSVAAALAAAGCGGGRGTPRLERSDAAPLIALAHRIPHEGACAQARDIALLRRRAIALVNARRVPAELQEPMMSGVTALGADAPVCLAKVSPAAPSPPPTPPHQRKPEPHHEHGHGHRHKPK